MELSERMNPLLAGKEDNEEVKKEVLGQFDPPFRKKVHKFAPMLLKCDGKIVKYDMRGLGVWRALVSFSHTILTDWDTWNHLTMLTVICFITMAIVMLTGGYKSIEDTNSVTSRIQLLVSFIFSAYVSIVINRWDRIRNTTLGQQWGATENLVLIAFRILKHGTPQEVELADRAIRYGRLCMKLTFMAAQADGNLDPVLESKLVTEKEKEWLEAAQIGTRPLMIVIWFSEFFDELMEKGYKFNEIYQSMIISNIASMRGGIGASLGAIGTQLPYPYVHIVYWVIQILLLCLAVETGVVLATNVFYKVNGGGFYSPPDDDVAWPQQPNVWYMNEFLQITASNMIFALFCEGLLKICDKLSNPMSTEDTSFSERIFDCFMFNNCRAMRAGYISYTSLGYTELESRRDHKPLASTIAHKILSSSKDDDNKDNNIGVIHKISGNDDDDENGERNVAAISTTSFMIASRKN